MKLKNNFSDKALVQYLKNFEKVPKENFKGVQGKFQGKLDEDPRTLCSISESTLEKFPRNF